MNDFIAPTISRKPAFPQRFTLEIFFSFFSLQRYSFWFFCKNLKKESSARKLQNIYHKNIIPHKRQRNLKVLLLKIYCQSFRKVHLLLCCLQPLANSSFYHVIYVQKGVHFRCSKLLIFWLNFNLSISLNFKAFIF